MENKKKRGRPPKEKKTTPIKTNNNMWELDEYIKIQQLIDMATNNDVIRNNFKNDINKINISNKNKEYIKTIFNFN